MRPNVSGGVPDRGTAVPKGRIALAHSLAFLARYVEEVRESVCRHAAAIRGAVRSGDAEALSSAAHHLRRDCDVIGAKRMATLAARLEELGEVRVQEELPPLMTEFRIEYWAVRRLLDVAVIAARTAATMGEARIA